MKHECEMFFTLLNEYTGFQDAYARMYLLYMLSKTPCICSLNPALIQFAMS